MIILWLDQAIEDLQALREYIAQDKPSAAKKVAQTILKSVELLAQQPNLGRPGRVQHTRELIIPNLPYLIAYQVKSNKIEILRILHAAMQWPEDL